VKPSALEKLKAQRKEAHSIKSVDRSIERLTQNSIRMDLLQNLNSSKFDEMNAIRFEMQLGIITIEQAQERYQFLKQKYLDLSAQLDIDYPLIPVIDLTVASVSATTTVTPSSSTRPKRKLVDLIDPIRCALSMADFNKETEASPLIEDDDDPL
jgi:hypothetical protein